MSTPPVGDTPFSIHCFGDVLLNFLPIIIALCVLIVIHEAGHFLAARWSGMRVHEFAVGFGPKIFSFKYGETEYSFRLILLGGYVRIAGMHPGEEDADDPRSFLNSAPWKRFVSILAGPLANYLAALGIFILIFSLWGQDSISPAVKTVGKGSLAAKAGLLPSDRLLSVNGKGVYPNVRQHIQYQFLTLLSRHDVKKPLALTFKRDGKKRKVKLKVATKHLKNRLGIQLYTRKKLYVTTVSDSSLLKGKVQSGDQLLRLGKYALSGKDSLPVLLTLFKKKDTALILKRQGKEISIPLLKSQKHSSTLGLTFKTEVQLLIGKLKPGSLAQSDGLAVGDQLIAIGPTPLRHRFDGSFEGSWKKQLGTCGKRDLALQVYRPSSKNSLTLRLPRQKGLSAAQCAQGLVLKDNAIVIEWVKPDSTASRLGLKAKDVVLVLDGERIYTGFQVSMLIQQRVFRSFDMIVKRGKTLKIVRIPKARNRKNSKVGIAMMSSLALHRKLSFSQSVKNSAVTVVAINVGILKALGEVFQGKRSFLKDFSSPVGIVKAVAKRQRMFGFDLRWLLFIAAQISISLALFNLFPIPALDGGRLMFLAVQQLVRLFGWKDHSMIRVETIANILGFVLLFGLLIIVTIKDFLVG